MQSTFTIFLFLWDVPSDSCTNHYDFPYHISILPRIRSWEEFKNRIAAQEASHSEMFEDEQITGNVSTQDDNDGPISALVALMNKLNVKTAPKHTTTDSDEVAHASECTLRNANANPFDKALIEAQNGYNVASENIAWGAAQVHYNISSMSGNAGPPVQPYMSTEDEQRARMTALFKAVDPSKLSRVDMFVEKRKKSKAIFGLHKSGFDRRWKSYKEKWGARAVNKAFEEVDQEKKAFYRAKTLALFAGSQPPCEESVIDGFLVKYDGKYDEMYKLWISTKKFNSHAIAVAHETALQQLGK